jgi:hypothetical protein
VLFAGPVNTALSAAAAEAVEWGGELTVSGSQGHLYLPVLAGIRRGVVAGTLTATPADGGTLLHFAQEERTDWLHTPAVAILVMAALGGVLVILWPLFPRLLPVAPLGAVLAIAGWMLVVSRLQSSGPAEYLGSVAARARAEASTDRNPR